MGKRPIFWKLYPSYLFLIVISILAVSWFSIRAQRSLHLEQTSSNLEARAILAKYQITDLLITGDRPAIDSLCKLLGSAASTRITVIFPSGEVIGDSDKDPSSMESHGNRPEIKQAFASGKGEEIRYSNTIQQRLMYKAIVIEKSGQVLGVLRTSIPITFIDQALNSVRIRMLIDGLIIAILSAALGLYISRRISKPLQRLKMGAERFSSGDLQRKLLIEGNTIEIDTLAEAMNEMAEQLGQRIDTITNQRNEQEAIFYSMIEGVIAIDSDSLIININNAAAKFFNLDIDAVEGKSLHRYIRSSALQRVVDETLISRKTASAEVEYEGRTRKYGEVTSTMLQGADGHQIGILIVVNDVTRMRQLEKMRRDFVANVSHELKTPITAIQGFVETLIDGAVEKTEDAKHFLGIIKKQSDRLHAIIEDLLSLARIEQGAEKESIELTSQPIGPVLQDAIDCCRQKAESKDISIELIAEGIITVPINTRLLEQAVINLISNAITYSENGSDVKIKANVFGDEVAISVIDTGCGIDAEHHSRLFERFYRIDRARSRELGGTGLGLAIVKHIALAHNGLVAVESEIDKGSTFTVKLPR